MGLMSRMWRPKALGSWGPEDDRWYSPGGAFYGGGGLSTAGVEVDSLSAMRLITVQNCVRMRASTLARLPCHVMRRTGKKKERATDFYLYEKLHDQPNEWLTANDFWAMAEAFVCLRGNFYAYKVGLENRPFSQLVPINDKMISVKQNNDYSLTYKVRFSNGDERDVPQSRILHVRGLTLDGITGANPIEYARETVGNSMASVQFIGRYFGKGMHPGAVIETERNMQVGAHQNYRKAFTEKYSSLGKTHELMLVDDGMKIKFPEIKLVDAQFLEQAKLSEAQIHGLYRVPLMLTNGGDKSPTYASADRLLLFYQMLSIDAPMYEACIRRDLLTPVERKQYFAKFNMEALMRGTMKERAQFYKDMVNTEILNPNECRWLEDRNPYEGGDEFRTRTSTTKDTNAKTAEAPQ